VTRVLDASGLLALLHSLADRACLALAMERRLPVVTADRAWSGLGLDLDIQVIR